MARAVWCSTILINALRMTISLCFTFEAKDLALGLELGLELGLGVEGEG